jgi:gluconolactonase
VAPLIGAHGESVISLILHAAGFGANKPRMNPRLFCLSAILALTCVARAQNLAGDEALSKALIPGEEWQEIGSGYGFTDAACSDASGNFYFSDLPKSVLYKVTPDGKVSPFWEGGPKISGLKFGPDGRLYACTQGPKKQVVAIALPSKEIKVLADDVQPNDLIVSAKGFVYFTETGKGQVTGIDIKAGKVFTAGTKLNAPNGIALSPDGGTLAVSEYKGSNVWTYRVKADGTLDAGAPYMTLRTPTGRPESAGDGMTVDSSGRYYVTSAVGIQMFDTTGRMGGVIANPQKKGTVSCVFAGEKLQYLYACSTDKVYRRKLKTGGAWLFGK